MDQLFLIKNDEDRAQAQRMARGLQGALGELAAEFGWVLDNTSDLSRVMRIAGTVNHKSSPVPVRALEVLW